MFLRLEASYRPHALDCIPVVEYVEDQKVCFEAPGSYTNMVVRNYQIPARIVFCPLTILVSAWGVGYLTIEIIGIECFSAEFPSPDYGIFKSFFRILDFPFCGAQVAKNTLFTQKILFQFG